MPDERPDDGTPFGEGEEGRGGRKGRIDTHLKTGIAGAANVCNLSGRVGVQVGFASVWVER